MERNGYLSAETMVRAQGKTVVPNVVPMNDDEALFTYIDMVLDEAEERYQLSNEEILTGGYTIIVPINKELQLASFSLLQEERFFPTGNDDAEAPSS